jgi:hypothetical protein
MQFNYSYKGESNVQNNPYRMSVSFAPDVKRKPTFFSGELRKNIEFREAISALHDVVVSDMRFKPKDKTAYKEWSAERDEREWQLAVAKAPANAAKMRELQNELNVLITKTSRSQQPFQRAKQNYFDYLYKKERDVWFVLDPVITVHPDELFFECFSQDESSYGRLGASYEVFKNIGEFSCGTTNIDYSAALYDEFQKIRTYKTTRFEVDPSGFDVQTTGEDDYKEVKIDLPDSWVRGFLQVSSAMALPMTSFVLHPMDLHNICFILRRHKEVLGPRGMRYILKPGQPVQVIFEPWDYKITCPRSFYDGNTEQEIRVWGRRRMHILERLIPIAKRVTVHLLGTGMPSFYVVDLGDMSFTLGLSGWSANDWSKAGNFDLLAPRSETDNATKSRVFEALKEKQFESVDSLAARLSLDRASVLGALGAYTQAGRAIYDIDKQVYRVRELSRDPLPFDKLRFANEREQEAANFLARKAVTVGSANIDSRGVLQLKGSVSTSGKLYYPLLLIDADQRIIDGGCGCYWHQTNKLTKGPCEHMIALRLQHRAPKR